MKKDQLIKMLRPLIKEEVTKIIREVVPSLLAEVVSEIQLPAESAVSRQRSTTNRPVKTQRDTLKEMLGYDSKPKEQTKQQFTTDPMLNDLLNETNSLTSHEQSSGITSPALQYANEYENNQLNEMSMDDSSGEHNFNSMKPLNGYGSKMESLIPTTDASGNASAVTAEDLAATAPGVMAALTKDYSSVIAKSKEISSQKAPSNINFEAPLPNG